MALGDGCWSPGIHWDGENSAAFTGPRAGAWPYSGGCTLAARSGLFVDSTTGAAFTYPPVGMNALVASCDQGTAGVSLPAGYLIAPSSINNLLISGLPLTATPPAYSCPVPGCHDQQLLTLDITLGTSSYLQVLNNDLSVPNGYNTMFSNRGAPGTIGTSAKRSVGTWTLTYKVTEAVGNFSDDPYGAAPRAGAAGFTGSWTLSPAHGDWAAADPTGPQAASGTVMAWCKPRILVAQGQYGMAGVVFSFDGTNNNALSIGQTNTNPTSWLVSNASDDTGPPPASQNLYNVGAGTMVLGAWQHVAITWSGSSFTVYVNGVSFGSGSYANWGGSRFTVGAISPGGGTNKFDGQIAHVMYFASTVLTGTQIQAIMNNSVSPSPTPTQWWPLNDPANPCRMIKTITVPRAYTYAGLGPWSRWRIDGGSGSATSSVLNAWSLQLGSTFYTPNLAAAV